MFDVICLGELLVDFVSEDSGALLEHAVRFRRAPGGAPANVACGVVKLGGAAAFVGKVGDDPFGVFLRYTLDQVGVDTSHLLTTTVARTTLVFVAVHRDGRKDMCFYRHPGADMLLRPEELDEAWLADARALHFGSISLMAPEPRAATIKAAQIARRRGALVTFDPNYRAKLWKSEAEARRVIVEGLPLADVVKLADDEFELVTGTDDFAAGARDILAAGPRLVVVTRGAGGCTFFAAGCKPPDKIDHPVWGTGWGEVPGFGVEAIETTGAGDAFMASLIVDLLAERSRGRELVDLDEATLQRICTRANAAGALTCTRLGAIPGLPTREEVDKFLTQMRE